MGPPSGRNFAAALLARAGEAMLIDAPTGAALGQLADRAARLAAAWRAQGVEPGAPVVLCLDLGPASAVAYLAALWAGLVVVPVDADTLQRFPDLPHRVGATAAWRAPSPKEPPPALAALLRLVEDGAGHPPLPAAPRAADDPAVLAPTSGTTRAARLVVVTHDNLLTNTAAIARSQGLDVDDRAMLVLPLHYCFGASVLHSHLWAGGSVVFDRRWMFPDKVLRAIAEHGCTSFAGVPTTFTTLLRHSSGARIPMPTLRRLLQAGGALDVGAQEELRACLPAARLHVMYGQTEATARLTTLPPDLWSTHRGSVGPFLPGIDARVVDETGQDRPDGEPGEVWVRGASITRGYWGDPEATAERFVGEWLRTGDLGRLDADGCLWLLGRLGSFIKVRGIRVNPEEVEALLRQDPELTECGVCGVPHPDAGEALAIFVRSGLPAEALRDRVRRALPPRWTWAWVRAVPELPRTAAGKLARAELARLAREPADAG